MRIVHIVKQFYPVIGGLESYVLSLALNQIDQGHQVSVVTLNRDFKTGERLSKTESHESGLKIMRVSYFGPKKYPAAPGVLKHTRECDLIHVHGVDFFIDFFSVTKGLHRKRLVLTTHGGYFHTSWGYYFKKLYFNIITRFTIRRYDVIIGCSDNDVNIFKRIIKRIQKIDNGVDIQKYLRIPKKPVKGELLYVGRIDIHKGISRLIHVTASLIRAGHDVRLNVIGPNVNNLRQKLEKEAEELDVSHKVTFRGAVDDQELTRAFSSAWLFLSASEYEGFGISAIEAMASGTLCVLNDIESFRGFLLNKDFGSVTNFSDLESSADTIAKYLDMPEKAYNQLSDDARAFSGNYDWTAVSQKITSLYSK